MWAFLATTKISYTGLAPAGWWNRDRVAVAVAVTFTVLVTALILRALIRIHRAKRAWKEVRLRAALKCVHCGYDLRAARDTCPECGKAVPAQWAEARLDSGGWPPPRG